MTNEETGPQRHDEWGDMQRQAEEQRGTYAPDQPAPPDRTQKGTVPESGDESRQWASDQEDSGTQPNVASSIDEAYDTTAR